MVCLTSACNDWFAVPEDGENEDRNGDGGGGQCGMYCTDYLLIFCLHCPLLVVN